MDINRRKFLKSAGAVAASMVLPMQFSMRNAHAATGTKKLIVFNMHGGCDGLNLAVPLGVTGDAVETQYELYKSYRPTLQIPRGDLLELGANPDGLNFGLNPAMAALQPHFDKLAVFPATHSSTGSYPANRSHFFQMDMFGAGLSSTNANATDGKGWVGRYFDERYLGATSGIIAQDFTDATHGTFRGNSFTLNFKDPANLALGAPNESMADAVWNDIKGISGADIQSYAGRFKDEQSNVFDDVLPILDTVNFNRSANAMYPGGVGTNFKRAADMLLGLPELEIIHINLGGFDTHKNQGNGADAINGVGRQAALFKMYAESIVALYEDIGVANPALRSDIVFTVQTEFGRTIRENGDMGTDHGNASTWMAFGDSISGGVYGSYPGLEPENMNGGNWLRPAVNYRDIFSEVVGLHLGYADVSSVFPEYPGAANPLNFVV